MLVSSLDVNYVVTFVRVKTLYSGRILSVLFRPDAQLSVDIPSPGVHLVLIIDVEVVVSAAEDLCRVLGAVDPLEASLVIASSQFFAYFTVF